MKLSDAMRRGMRECPIQCTDDMFTYGDNDAIIACCALGAAMLGAWDDIRGPLFEVFPDLHAEYPGSSHDVYDQIVLWNDDGHLTIGQIANLLGARGF